MYKNSVKDIVNELNTQIDRVVRFLLPNGRQHGIEWAVGSICGEVGDSLKVHVGSSKPGIWSDFATGQSGDSLSLWAACRSQTISEAILDAKQWLGITPMRFEPHRSRQRVKPVLKSTTLTANSPPSNYLVIERKLNVETLKAYQIGAQGSEIIFPYYYGDEVVFVKYLSLERKNGKKIMRVEANCEPCLFGWQAIPPMSRNLVLTEGEIDAMSLYQYDLGYAVLSIPFGGGSGNKQQWIENEFDRLAMFDEIYLSLDNDEVGRNTTTELIKRLGRHRCRIVQLPCKDANECLQKDISCDEIKRCFQNALLLDPVELKAASTYVEQVLTEFYPKLETPAGYEMPWKKVEGKIHLRPDELSIYSGINGHGKSQILGQIVLNCMKQGARVCIASLELKPRRLLMRLTRQAAGLRNPTEDYIRAIHNWYDDRLWIFDLVGTAKVECLLEVFLYAKQRYGVDVFVIDSFMKCGILEDDYNAQKQFIERLCDFKNENECHIHIVIHPRKGSDENNIPGKLDIKGSGAITDLADNCFTTWRNKKKEEQVRKLSKQTPVPLELSQEPDCILSCDKHRNGEWEGKISLWFDIESFQYLEQQHQKPRQFVDYSCIPQKEHIYE